MWNGYKVVDADAHMHEPQDMWEKYVEPKYRAQAPKVAYMNGTFMVYEPDGKIIPKDEKQVKGPPKESFGIMQEKYGEAFRTWWAPQTRIKDMDRYGGVNFADRGVELSRPFRALKVWLTVKTFGLGEIRAALTSALTPHRGPAFLDLPLEVVFSSGEAAMPGEPAVPVLEADPGEVARAAALLAGAARPVIIAGSDVWGGDAIAALRAVAEALQVPVFANGMGRGALPSSHPLAFAKARLAGESDLKRRGEVEAEVGRIRAALVERRRALGLTGAVA